MVSHDFDEMSESENGSDHEMLESDEEGDMFPSNEEEGGNKRGLDDNSSNQQELPAKKKRKNNKEGELKKLQKPPTAEELTRLRETENLFHSNLFRRQIEEMLQELNIKNKIRVRVNLWVEKFKDWMGKMENCDTSYDLTKFDWLTSQKLILPLTVSKIATKGNYKFRKPSNVRVVGSYLTKTFLLKDGAIDINVTMPSQFFDKEDYLNGRYYVKRAMYLCEVAKHIKSMNDLVDEVKFTTLDGDNLHPALELVPAEKLKDKITFLVHLVPEETTFRLNRFVPSRNNVRSRWFFSEKINLVDEECSTPTYNAGILRDLRNDANETFLADIVATCPAVRDAIVLLKVWAHQRELHIGYGAFSGHIFTFIVAYLLHIRKISGTMSSYQIIRSAWNYLCTANWTGEGITMCSSTSEHQPTLSDFHAHFPLVFVDPSGFLNLCNGMCPTLFRRCQDEALLAVKSLDTPDVNCFQFLFMVPVPFSRLCDHTILFHNWSALEKLFEAEVAAAKKLDVCGVIYSQVRELIITLLTKAFGNRVERIFVGPSNRRSWALGKKPKTASTLTVGLLLDPVNCFNLVDRGPSANSEEAAGFREFWRNRSEMRRFKDGSITESVLWSGKTWSERRMICRQIAQFVLAEKFKLTSEDFRYSGDELEAVLPEDREEKTLAVNVAFEKLQQDLKGLDNLPLEVLSTQGASPVFRHTEAFPPDLPLINKKSLNKCEGNCLLVDPTSHKAPPWCAPAEVVLQLGSSNKWPRDLGAVRRLRAAFNVKIATLLSKIPEYTTHAFPDWVDVLTPACVFRLRIVYPGEVGLMKLTKTPDGIVIYRDTEESVALEKQAQHMPNLTSALNGLQSIFNSYGSACCLAKRWVRSLLLHPSHLCDEAIDLLVASVYVNPDPWRPPNQPQLAFLRFLALLATTNWNIECIILNFNHVLTREEIRKIESNFESNRSTLPCMFISTPDDQERSLWTRRGPSAVVLHRLALLAFNTLNLLQTQINDPRTGLDVKSIFQPASLTVFDVIITLVKGFLPRRNESLDADKCAGGSKVSTQSQKKLNPVINYNPVDFFLNELEESYGEWALFFYDPYGGSTIGVLWKPASKVPKDFKISHVQGRSLDPNKKLHLNINSILEGFYVLGTGLVKKVQVRQGKEFVNVNF